VLFGVLIAVLIISKIFSVTDHIEGLKGWINGLGVLGCVVFVLLHIAGMIAALPRMAFAFAAGVFFGSTVGIILVVIASTTGACVTFIIGRYFARQAVAQWVKKSRKLSRLYELTEKRGAHIIGIARLLPVSPANLLNYAFGLTKIRFTDYLLYSFITMLPGTFLYVLTADALATGLREPTIPLAQIIVAAIALTIMIVAAVCILKTIKPQVSNRPNKSGG